MLELSSVRKNKVNLADYNFQQDIENRMILADSSPFDLEVLEEILFSPLKISLQKLARNMGCKEEKLLPFLGALSKTGLLSLQGDLISVDKESRKYFEFQIARFDPAFKPDLDFIQGILRSVPIHLLPVWYAIPRTSNNIFESVIEKYFLTPQIFQRYVSDLHFSDPLVNRIISDLLAAPDYKLHSSDLITKYNLERRALEEIFLLLEFHFVGYLSYEKEDDHWIEVITPFYEWRSFLQFIKSTETPLLQEAAVKKNTKTDFFFIEEMSKILSLSLKKPLLAADLTPAMQKLILTQLARHEKGHLHPTESALDWLEKTPENRSLYLYRHPMNRILSLPPQIATERNVREAEKSIRRVLHGQWVRFDDFLKGALVTLSEESVVTIKRIGKQYRYTLPIYGENEQKLLKATLFEWLVEMGMVETGVCQENDCFRVTPFGRFCFED